MYFRRRPFTGRYITIDSLGRRVTPQPFGPESPAARVFFYGGSTMWGTSQRGDRTIPAEAARRQREGADAVPDVVVFYDGINDVIAVLQNGVAGVPQNETNRATDFAMGRVLDRSRYNSGIGEDLRALGMLSRHALEQLEVVERLALFVRPVAPLPTADSAAHALVRTYVENVRVVESMSRAYGDRRPFSDVIRKLTASNNGHDQPRA